MEEGLHQAVVVKLSPRSPGLHDLRGLLPKVSGIKGHCFVGHLAPRQLLIGLDQYEDFVTALARPLNYFRTMEKNINIVCSPRQLLLILRKK